MVMRRGDARHKDVSDPLEAPKRVTVHAQRKFAQGSGINSPVMSPIKEKEKSKVNGAQADLSLSTSPSSSGIPAKRPRTEDFITFLCYRGTSVLPPALNSFNVASKPEKNERETVAVEPPNQASPTRQVTEKEEKKINRARQTKRMVMQSKSKVLDQRQRKSRLNTIAQKGKVAKNKAKNPITKGRLKKVAAAVVGKNPKGLKGRPIMSPRASHPAILKRLGASRARVGLRSGGQLPPGSDVGIKTDRKPRGQELLETKAGHSPAAKNSGRGRPPVLMKFKRGRKPASAPPSHTTKSSQKITPNKAHPKNLNLATRPSRKTKEAAALYMEMITKDLRSPDEEDDLNNSFVNPKDKDVDATPVKTRTRSSIVEASSEGSSPVNMVRRRSQKGREVNSPSLSPAPNVKRGLKLNSLVSLAPKVLIKRSRVSLKDKGLENSPAGDKTKDAASKSPVGRGRKSLRNDKNELVQSTGRAKAGKKGSLTKAEAASGNEVPSQNEDEDEEENHSSQPSPRKVRKFTDTPETRKAGAVGTKSANLKKSGTEVVKKNTKEPEESAQGKRSMRSSGAVDTSARDCSPEKTQGQKAVTVKGHSTKSRGKETAKKASSSESEEEKDLNKPVKKVVTAKTRQSSRNVGSVSEISDEESKKVSTRTKKPSRKALEQAESESEDEKETVNSRAQPTKLKGRPKSGGESEDEAQTAPKKLGRPLRASTKVQDKARIESEDDAEGSTSQPRTAKAKGATKSAEESDNEGLKKPGRPSRKSAKAQDGAGVESEDGKELKRQSRGAKFVETAKSAEDSDSETHVPAPRKPGRPAKKVVVPKESAKDVTDKRPTRKSVLDVEEKQKKDEVKIAKKDAHIKQESDSSSESDDVSDKASIRKTRNRKSVDVKDESNAKPLTIQKRSRLSGPVKADESGEESAKKVKKAVKPVDEEPNEGAQPKAKKQGRPPAKEATSAEESPKVKQLKQGKAESGGESEKEIQPKRGRPPKKVIKDTEKGSVADKELGKLTKATRKAKKEDDVTSADEEGSKKGRKEDNLEVNEVVEVTSKRASRSSLSAASEDVKAKVTEVVVLASKSPSREADLDTSDKDQATKRGRRAAKAQGKEPELPKDKKEPCRAPRVVSKAEEDKRKIDNSLVGVKKVDAKKSEQGDPVKKAGRKSDSKLPGDYVKSEKVPAKRGRKPKKIEQVEEPEEEKPGANTRPRRSARATIKRESYSEYSDGEEEDDENDEGSMTLPRTRGRRSNVKYTENDTDESETSEVERQPRRSRRSVFTATMAVDLDSDIDDDFIELSPPTRHKRSKAEVHEGSEERKEAEKSQNDGIASNLRSSRDEDDPVVEQKAKGPVAVSDQGADEGNSDLAPKLVKAPKIVSKNLPDVKSPDSNVNPAPSSVAKASDVTKDAKEEDVKRVTTPAITVKMEDPIANSSTRCKAEEPPEPAVLEVKPGSKCAKGLGRRMSRDKTELEVPQEASAAPVTIEVTMEKRIVPSMSSPAPLNNFELGPSGKGDYDNNNGLAILSDVALTELQNRKNAMRKLSSDSATSFSSDDVPRPVRKEKVLPKAKADLPTVREKTESDEDISDVAWSDYGGYKGGKQERRKRLPKRTRREPVRIQSQRPVRSRRAKLTADSYVDDESFSSDRSSSPEIPPPKPVQKRRKSEDKHAVESNPNLPTRTAQASSTSSVKKSAPVVLSAPLITELRTSKDLGSRSKEAKPHVADKVKVIEVPKPPPPKQETVSVSKQPQFIMSKDAQSEAKNNNSVTLFAGVSGVPVKKPDDRPLPAHRQPKEQHQVGHFSNSAKKPENPPKPPPYIPTSRPAISSSQASFAKSALYNTTPPMDITSSAVDVKTKPNIGDTWKNAFKNAKIPKPGQLSPAHHSSVSTPFMRKVFSNSPKTPPKPEPNAFPQGKLPGVQTFKTSAFQNLGKLGNQSPSRIPGGISPGRPPVSSLATETKSHVYLSPSRAKSSPSKTEEKKPDAPTKSLTLLQYEKRSQEILSSLKGSQPVLVDGTQSYVPAFPTKLKEYSMEAAKSAPRPALPPPPTVEEATKSEGGKHVNLPFAVDSALRRRSPITVKKPTKPPEKKAVPTITIPEVPSSNVSKPPRPIEPSTSAEPTSATTKLELLSKKKVQMTNEEINKWLDDSTSTGVEHAKDCGIFENNQCECSYRTSGESMLNSSVGVTIMKEEPKIDHGVVEPPVQLKELDSGSKFTAETISTCKVEEYKEKMLKVPKAQEIKKELAPPAPKVKKPMNLVVDKGKKKSMTEDEMCDFDFRFERTPNSPRESRSDMSSPTPRDDVSSSNEEKFDPTQSAEKKSIFHQRRQVVAQKKLLSKSPSAFNAENESSVYAFEDAPPPALSSPFRRRGSRNKSSEDDLPASSSIAVQVNLENVGADSDQVLECSTQTEQVDSEGQLFYFPLEGESHPQQVIQGVQVKLQSTEGPEQKVIMKAKLVTKPSLNIPTPSSRPLGDAGRAPQRPEQKVRPLATTSTSTQSKPLGTVTPTIREAQPGCSATFNSKGTTTTSDRPELTNQSTQAVALQLPLPPPPPPLPPPSPQVSTPVEETTKATELPPSPALSKAPQKSTPSATPAPRRSATNEFPVPGTTPRVVEALTFYPTEKEFQDPLEYIEQITPLAQTFGICRIVPPASFKPECKVSDDMRFTAYNQYVHKMLYRWGPNVKEMTAIKKYLATQSIALKQPPWIGGMEIDLPRLYQTVQACGGLKEVIEKKRWAKVADMMKIPKAAQDRVTKLDDIYCKFLLPYDTLSHAERSKLLEEVDAEWTERERRIALEAERESKGEKEEKEENSDSDEESDDGRDECITKGKTMPLSQFYRIARNTMAMWFKEPNPSAKEVEIEYWRQVNSRKQHVCVNSGSIDSGAFGYGFPTSKSSSTSRHPWNLKVLTNNCASILRSMGPIMGVTVPTLHVGMLFSACCWYRDPHGLPWIEYLHTGANKIWYAVPDLWNEELHCAMRTILPRYCQDKPIWLASDTAMVPPDLLVQQGVSLCRAVQEPGQFILVFPKAFTSTICTGYIVSESVYFAQPSWLHNAVQIFKDIQESCEPPAFSLERLLFNIATDIRSSAEVLTQILPMITELRDTELLHRKQLEELGVTETERLAVSKGGRKKSQEEPEEYECEICRGNLYLSLVANSVEEANFCLLHSVETLTKDRSHVKNCKLMYSYDEEEMNEVLEKMKLRIETKTCKKQTNKTTSGNSKL